MKRNHTGRRKRNQAISADKGNIKQLLPIYDKPMILLSVIGIDERGHQGDPDHIHTGRYAAL